MNTFSNAKPLAENATCHVEPEMYSRWDNGTTYNLRCIISLSIKMQAVSSILSVVDGYQTQLANWADKPNFDYEAFVTISTWLQTGFEVFLM